MNTNKKLRVATWNLDHASNGSRPIELQIKTILDFKPDIIVLTETCEAVDLALHGYQVAYPESKNEYGKYYAAIWSKFHIGGVFKTTNEVASVCAQITSPIGDMMIYGTIIPYRDYKGRDKSSGAWVEHYKAITDQGNDWGKLLIETRRSLPLIVAGDFNQTRDGSQGTYGTNEGRQQLTEMLERNNLCCLTEENFGELGKLKTDHGKKYPRNNIDHICMTKGSFSVAEVGAWDHFTEGGVYLSDHNGVYVDLVSSRRAE